MKEQYPETTSKERINAAISYFFMGPMVLLATNNPTFNVLFIQEHAKRATKWLMYAAGAFIVHFFWLSQVTSFFIPIIGIRLDKTITFCIFLAYFILTLIGAYQALQGMKAQGIAFGMKDIAGDTTFSLEMNESEKLRTIACYLPIISLFVANPNELGKIGRVTSNWFTVLLLTIVTLGFTEISQLALSSLYILFVVSLGVFIFLNKEPTFLRLVAFLPKKEAVQAGIYTIPLYLWQVIQAIIGKRSELSFSQEFTKKLQKEEQFEQVMSEVFTDNSSPFSPYTLYIPGINAIHLATFLSPKKSRNVIASGQGIIITILFALGIYFFDEYDSILLILVYVSVLGISRVKERPFYKIPGIYELYWFISLVTFGLISGAGTAKNKSAEVREETIRVQP